MWTDTFFQNLKFIKIKYEQTVHKNKLLKNYGFEKHNTVKPETFLYVSNSSRVEACCSFRFLRHEWKQDDTFLLIRRDVNFNF